MEKCLALLLACSVCMWNEFCPLTLGCERVYNEATRVKAVGKRD